MPIIFFINSGDGISSSFSVKVWLEMSILYEEMHLIPLKDTSHIYRFHFIRLCSSSYELSSGIIEVGPLIVHVNAAAGKGSIFS